MVSIRNEKFVKYEDNLSVVRVRINVDSADELPETDDFSGKILYQGSTARDLSTGDLYALTSEGEWILQTAGGGSGTSDYGQLSNKPSINNVTLQGNKSLSDIGTYSKAEIDGMTEIETIEFIYDRTEKKRYFPSDKRYILEKHKPFYLVNSYDSSTYCTLYIFSDSSIYDNGQDNPTGAYTYANLQDLNSLGGIDAVNGYGYSVTNTYCTIDAGTLEVQQLDTAIDDEYLHINVPVNPVTGITYTGSITKRRDRKNNPNVYFSEEKYVFDLSFTINTSPSDGIIAAYSRDEIIDCVIVGRLIRDSSTRVIYIYVDSDYSLTNPRVLRTDTTLKDGDIIKINHSMTTLYGENKMD